MNNLKQYSHWLNSDYFDRGIRDELQRIREDAKEIEDRFYRELAFGTGGLRGVIGAGTNRMNIYTVRKASQGIADYINDTVFPEGVNGVAIAYDSRRMSREFAEEAAAVFASNGIHAKIFRELMPTPILSYAVRHLKCAAGVVITASHNPKEYNGYKVYGSDGGQITDKLAGVISGYIQKIPGYDGIAALSFDEALQRQMVSFIEDEVLESYFNHVLNLSCGVPLSAKSNLKAVYSPLHGTGFKPVTEVLSRTGIKNLSLVEEQCPPDSDFCTVRSPNPEEQDALEMAICLGKETGADIVFATDPDCDRLGLAIRTKAGEYRLLNGNQIGCLLLDFILKTAAGNKKLPPDGYVVKTIVTTDMAKDIAAFYGVPVHEVLTGFKYIGQMIMETEKTGKGKFLFGLEESYGYLAGTFVRDKDAVITAMLVSEAAAYYKEKGQTLADVLNSLYEKHGYYKESLKSFTFRGKDGLERLKRLMASLRAAYPEKIGGLRVAGVRDYLKSTRIAGASLEALGLPVSDVLYFEMEGGNWLAIRPSGTEPKLKVYAGVKGKTAQACEELIKELNLEIERLLENHTEGKK